MIYIYQLLSFLLVAFAAPYDVSWLAPVAAALGYGLFWSTLDRLSLKKRFIQGAFWQFGVQLIQLKWLSTTTYNGPLMIGVYIFACVCLGALFGLLSTFAGRRLRGVYLWGFAGLGTLLEYLRWYPLCGFSWNPAGLFLSTYTLTAQMASVGGILLLSFWVYLTNAAFAEAMRSKRGFRVWGLYALVPYVVGALSLGPGFFKDSKEIEPYLSVLAVEPYLAPPVKAKHPKSFSTLKSPLDNWNKIFALMVQPELDGGVDLVALPEAAFAFEASELILPREGIKRLFHSYFGEELILPDTSLVTHNDVLRAVTRALQLPIVTGHIDVSKGQGVSSLAAFFEPEENRSYYAKRRLFPVAEYMPYEWCKKIGADFGIYDAFSPGKSAEIFTSKRALKHFPKSAFPKLGPMVCYEETFPKHANEAIDLGADLLVGLSNDAWYPEAGLEQVHLAHAKVRAIESGAPLLRVCNTGISCAIDAKGNVVSFIESKGPSAVCLKVPLKRAFAPYVYLKDRGPLMLAALSILLSLMRFIREKRTRFVLA